METLSPALSTLNRNNALTQRTLNRDTLSTHYTLSIKLRSPLGVDLRGAQYENFVLNPSLRKIHILEKIQGQIKEFCRLKTDQKYPRISEKHNFFQFSSIKYQFFFKNQSLSAKPSSPRGVFPEFEEFSAKLKVLEIPVTFVAAKWLKKGWDG